MNDMACGVANATIKLILQQNACFKMRKGASDVQMVAFP